MKKVAIFFTMALIFSLCSTTVIAASPMNGRNFVDDDGDGNCDNYTSNGNGCGRRPGCGKGYVDAVGDGVCDNKKYTIKYNLNGGKNNKKNSSPYL